MPNLLGGVQPRRLAVFRALQLGDMLCAVPALRALRAALPDAHMTLIGLPWAHAFAERFAAYIDGFLPFPGYPGLPEQAADLEAYGRFLEDAQGRHFDLAIQLHGSGRVTNGIVAQLGARAVAGFSASLPYPEDGPEIRRLLSLVEALGAASRGEALEFPLSAADEAELSAFAAERALPRGPCICLHPGARAPDRRWPPAHFAAVADALHARSGLPIVLTGSAPEQPLIAEVRRAMRAPAADAAGPISVGALAAQIARARLLVTNDTGVSHLAAALGVPSVVIFMASELERWAPLDRALHRPVWDPEKRLMPEVLAQARSLLDGFARAPARGPALLPG